MSSSAKWFIAGYAAVVGLVSFVIGIEFGIVAQLVAVVPLVLTGIPVGRWLGNRSYGSY